VKVLVTGASGFVGRALVHRLSSSADVDVFAGVRKRSDDIGASRSQVLLPDLSATGDWRHALAGIDVVAHLAARVHVMSDRAVDPLAEYRRVNVAGTLALAQQAAAVGVRRFVFFSSVKVHGEATPAGHAFREEDALTPTDPYGISKAEAEAALFALGKDTGMEVVVIRPPLVYGPGVRANFLAMMRWLARGVPLPLGAIHDNRRSLVAIDNLVDLVATSLRHPAAANNVFLVSDGDDLSTTELLRRIAAAMRIHPRLIPVPTPLLSAGASAFGMRHIWQRLGGNLQVDISKARELLGWRPPVTVDEGLRRTVVSLAPEGVSA
jgi:nucleoside-diphosphate-sugar epimerase